MSVLKNIKALPRPFKEDESKFLLKTALKVTVIPVLAFVFIFFIFWIFVRFDLLYFESVGLRESSFFAENYYAKIFNEISRFFYLTLGFLVTLFFVGIYIGNVLIRPFKILAQYCEKVVQGESYSYNSNLFSDFRILTRFSDYFFTVMESARKNQKLEKAVIPTYFTGIHKPVFDQTFFFHFCVLIMLICLSVGFMISSICFEVHGIIVQMAIDSLKEPSQSVARFLNSQQEILIAINIYSITSVALAYIVLVIHLYGKVSGAAFGIFATMRSFLKGRYDSRIHLVGYSQVRGHTRKINKFLDYMQQNFVGD